MGRVGRLSCEHMDGLQTEQTRWFGLREPERSRQTTRLCLCEVPGHQDTLLKTGLSEECLPDWTDGIWQLR
jgi:hypothetical protein